MKEKKVASKFPTFLLSNFDAHTHTHTHTQKEREREREREARRSDQNDDALALLVVFKKPSSRLIVGIF